MMSPVSMVNRLSEQIQAVEPWQEEDIGLLCSPKAAVATTDKTMICEKLKDLKD